MTSRAWLVVLILIAAPLVVGLALWLWVLASPDPLASPPAAYFPWPIACSSRGCVTTTAWEQHFEARRAYAVATNTDSPTSAPALQTLMRQHLVQHGIVRSPVTLADARRYREEILNVKTEDQLKNVTGLTLAQYDQAVILPFLQQEALRQQRKVETIDELFHQLAAERWLVVLPFSLGWDKEKAVVTTNSLYVPAAK